MSTIVIVTEHLRNCNLAKRLATFVEESDADAFISMKTKTGLYRDNSFYTKEQIIELSRAVTTE